ncbi:MAG: metallophosphoesterase [Deltaproteobacteria bacterium]|nr:metallophosphoesterase [Deltaproteobacteria bacterium]
MNGLMVFVTLFGATSSFSGVPGYAVPPCLQGVTRHEAVLFWQQIQNRPVEVRYRTGRSAYLVQHLPAGTTLHRVVLSGLVQGRRYEYGVRIQGQDAWASGRFKTEGRPSDSFTFLVMGDTRSDVLAHSAVVDAMATEDAAFFLHTGDVVARPEELLYRRFFAIEWPLLRNVSMLPALGNHELSGSWQKGRALFKKFFRFPNRGPGPGIEYSFVYGNSMVLFLDSNMEFTGSEQTSWATSKLIEAMSDPTIRHVFVVIHHGPFSSGPHGPNWELVDSELMEQFQRFGVDIIFSGHDHLYERGRIGNVRYVVSAGGGAPLYPIKRRLPNTEVVESTHHYVRVRVSGDAVEVAAYRLDGSLLDWFSYVKAGADSIASAPVVVAARSDGPRRLRHASAAKKLGRGPRRPARLSGCDVVSFGALLFFFLGALVLVLRRQYQSRTRTKP